eukprot:Gregarina_sp_Poly_1__2423@NODE_164_length_12220_cov_166_864807_g146_i0_p2_GENE_NODE_164_length_12220_cov_166_864807_g146_i0NODE_164_length_12220_cov_166_864807_g146_i0_p2_ORF_typecomplete_len749_score97_59PUF/PF00806_19/3_2e02PUF/PF00806_19/1e06PUF/PF00806_19/0_078PUF/PF00806_19/0_011PUF/PF00806_19/1_4e06PUF/PF00806_19/4_4e07PUF/PF00806_19/0_04PUF/PF00806_19/0_01CPL/PF08144_11/1_9e02CPL/PF08144_11/0_65CPL/PF08144_11/21_NODE_164_length_12220_cov_166_864807_g146_i061728418
MTADTSSCRQAFSYEDDAFAFVAPAPVLPHHIWAPPKPDNSPSMDLSSLVSTVASSKLSNSTFNRPAPRKVSELNNIFMQQCSATNPMHCQVSGEIRDILRFAVDESGLSDVPNCYRSADSCMEPSFMFWDPSVSQGADHSNSDHLGTYWNSPGADENFGCHQDSLELMQSFRAIQSVIAESDREALSLAVNRLASVIPDTLPTQLEWPYLLSIPGECSGQFESDEALPGDAGGKVASVSESTTSQAETVDFTSPVSVERVTNEPHLSHVEGTEDDIVQKSAPGRICDVPSGRRSSHFPPAAQDALKDRPLFDFCKGNVVALSLKDQATCRSLQKYLKETGPEAKTAVLREALPHFVRLMTDPIGNYFCQTILQVCSAEELRQVLDRVWKQLPSMSKSLYGTRAVQKLIEKCATLNAKKLLKAFAGHITDLAIDACGSHVVRQILESIPAEQSDIVHSEIRTHVLEISTTKRGCCAVQKCLTCCTEVQRHLLIKRILDHIPQLIQDPFGNYVIQQVLNMEDACINSQIIEYVLIDLWYLSKHKFASNVVERCVRLSNPFQLGSIMGSLVSLGVRKIRELLEDSFGNYVIQSVLESVPHETYGPLDRVVALGLPDLNQTAHGRRISQILLTKFPFLAETPRLYRDGTHQAGDSSNAPTSDNSMDPPSSTDNSRHRSSSSSRSKGRRAPADAIHWKNKRDTPEAPARGDVNGTVSTDDSATKPDVLETKQQRPNPHNLSLAINRFRISRR